VDDDLLAAASAAADQLEAHARDRHAAELQFWKDGRRGTEPPVEAWKDGDLDCAMYRNWAGALCGYVRLPAGHPWEGIRHNEPVPNPRELDDDMLMDEAFDDLGPIPVFMAMLAGPEQLAGSLAGQIRVHGGLTFTGPIMWGDVEPGWWLGFDCGHPGDRPDPEHAPPELRDSVILREDAGHVWTVQEVRLETARLAANVREAYWPMK
jgi:hypothetical protein